MTDTIEIRARVRAAMLCTLVAAGAVLPHAVQAAGSAAPLCLRGQVDAPVAFHGAASYDATASGSSVAVLPMMGVAGLVAGLVTSAVINDTMHEREKRKVREEADKVLVPYQAALANYKHRELMEASLAGMTSSGDKHVHVAGAGAAESETMIDGQPVFFMTQDQRALILENTVSIQAVGAAKPYKQVIRVVSPAQGEKTDAAAWLENNQDLLKRVSARMYAQSLDIALADMAAAGSADSPVRTVRYTEGGTRRFERAQVLSEQCGHTVLRTLRGDLMSVPRESGADAPGCAQPVL